MWRWRVITVRWEWLHGTGFYVAVTIRHFEEGHGSEDRDTDGIHIYTHDWDRASCPASLDLKGRIPLGLPFFSLHDIPLIWFLRELFGLSLF